MQDLLTLLQEHTAQVAPTARIARQNMFATRADADALHDAIAQGKAGHREFSLFTPPEGRA